MNRNGTGAACVSALLLSMAAAALPAQASAPISIQRILRAQHVPGAVLAASKDGRVVVRDTFGIRNAGSKVPVDIDTHFEIGSITKQFTAAAILQLMERGKLSLSDPLGKYVPEYAAGKSVTVEQLLWQVSGIPEYTDGADFVHFASTHPASLKGVLALIAGKPPAFAPGTKWAYSNTNYYLLGRIVEAVSGVSWEEYIRTHIFTPAGMHDSTFIDDEQHVRDMATGYVIVKGRLQRAPSFGKWADSAGGIVSTAGDLLRWDRALFAGKIVAPRDVRLMTESGHLADGSPTGYGFGWFAGAHDGQPVFFHSGGTFGFSAKNEYYPNLHEAIVVLENASAGSPTFAGSALFAALNPRLAAGERTQAPGEDPNVTSLAKKVWYQFARRHVDRSLFTQQWNDAMTPNVLGETAAHIEQMGPAKKWIFRGRALQGGFRTFSYVVEFSNGLAAQVSIALAPSGKIAQFAASPD